MDVGSNARRRRNLALVLVLLVAVVIIGGILALSEGKLSDAASNLLVALIWPFALASIVLVFRDEVGELVSTVKNRVQRGSGFKFGIFELTAGTENIPTPPASENVTLQNIALMHTSFISEEGTRQFNDGRVYYQFEVVVIAPKPVMARIKQVTYTLPEAWPEANRVKVIRDRQSRFKLKELANGTAIVLADVQFEDQNDVLHLNRFIDLRPEGPRI